MSPRPRTTSDEEILAATHRVIQRVGPGNLSLAAVGAEAGISPATIIQRFGSKRGLLLALVSGADVFAEACVEEARQTHGSPLQALTELVAQMAGMARTPEQLSNNLAFLQMDLIDPDFHAKALAHAVATLAGYRELIEGAIAAGELQECDPAALAEAISAMSGGALVSWAILREGDAESYVRRQIETLLGPYRASAG